MRQKDQADEVAGTSGLGRRIRFHRIYRMPQLQLIMFLIPMIGLCAGLSQFIVGWWLMSVWAVIIGAIAAYMLWPPRRGLRGIAVYDSGLVLLAGPQAVALPWVAITRVAYQKGRSRSESSGVLGTSRTVEVQYAFTRLWLRDETAPVTLAHVWRHRRLVRAVQAGIGPESVGETASSA